MLRPASLKPKSYSYKPDGTRQSPFPTGLRLACHPSICTSLRSKKRFGLSVLDYIVRCNHVRYLVRDTGGTLAAHGSNALLHIGRMAKCACQTVSLMYLITPVCPTYFFSEPLGK